MGEPRRAHADDASGDVYQNSLTAGTPVDFPACNGTTAQVWSVATLLTDELNAPSY